MNDDLKTLQLFYAGVLADSVHHYGKRDILDEVTAEKANDQAAAASSQLKYLGIEDVKTLFEKFSRIFGCAAWQIKEKAEDFEAVSSSCLLCAVAKKRTTEKPCALYCINPFREYSRVLGFNMSVKSTLWEGAECRFFLEKNN